MLGISLTLVEVLTEFCAESPDFIVLDYPFLYGHRQMNKFTNLAVFINTPLDIAMARRVIRDFEGRPTEEVIREMQHYLSRARPAYVDMLNTVKPQSDFVVDGSLSVQEIVDVILERLTSLHGI